MSILTSTFSGLSAALANQLDNIPVTSTKTPAAATEDWLLHPSGKIAHLTKSANGKELMLSNGLIQRSWRITPDAATVSFDNLMTGSSILRGVKPEAILEFDGRKYGIGGLDGQPDYAYLRPEWLDAMTANPNSFHFTGFETGPTLERFAWKRKFGTNKLAWPPAGTALTLKFEAPAGDLKGVTVQIHYEMFDNIPLITKWITIRNDSGRPVRLNTFINELLALVEYDSNVERPGHWEHPDMLVESDYEFIGMDPNSANKTTFWEPDPQYTTQVNYRLETPCLLHSKPPIGPNQLIPDKGTFETFRTHELVYDSSDRERKSLETRRFYRTIAPWVAENPILMHARSADPKAVRLAIDQCAEVGFEMVILSFGSGFDIENTDPAYRDQIKDLVAYANSKNIELGGYSLLASRRVDDENDAINPKTGKHGDAIFGESPCLCSKWGEGYFTKLYSFIQETGLGILEHDGSYPGDVCASTVHPGHEGLEDSQWKQWKKITDFYHWCRGRGVYLNVPDWYFLSGSSKTGMGYREVNWSLPRERQIILARQNIFDGTWSKTPSMGWMFVPLVEYQGGGDSATLEPLHEHLEYYEKHLMQNFMAGVQACYRGPRLFDTDNTKAVVKKWVDFYKKHRAILESDVIHLRRPDGRDYDGLLHVNSTLGESGLAILYNPLHETIKKTITLPLYYTGLKDSALIQTDSGKIQHIKLNNRGEAVVTITIPPLGYTYLTVKNPKV